MKQNETRKKGTFSRIRLGITKKYIVPFSRKRLLVVGGVGCLCVLIYFIFNSVLQHGSFISDGPVASAHANFEAQCSQCHDSFRSASNEKCSICHEKVGDKQGVYSFTAHYFYRPGNKSQANVSWTTYQSREVPCASCHPDHQGRSTTLTQVTDMKCISCHDYGSFNKKHPQFAFVRNQTPDDSTLSFTHIRHTKFVLEKLQKQIGSLFIENTCLYCHIPQSDGRNFKPLDFDIHCGECHLSTTSQTPPLAIKDPSNPSSPGVETLQMIQAHRGPGTLWSFYTNPNEFTVKAGTKIIKSPLYHKDPWVLENLKLLRAIVYADSGLSDLVNASIGHSEDGKKLYAEAIQTLRDYATGLRSRPEPEIQADLFTIDSLLKAVDRKAVTGMDHLAGTPFSLQAHQFNPNLTDGQREEIFQFAEKLTKPCRMCHMVSSANIMRVKSDQRSLTRAEFDHRAHILQRRCLECHTEIPISQVLLDKDTSAALLAKDRASANNIPRIENCFECHNEKEVSNQCVTCHYMHPNKDNRSNLQLFVETN